MPGIKKGAAWLALGAALSLLAAISEKSGAGAASLRGADPFPGDDGDPVPLPGPSYLSAALQRSAGTEWIPEIPAAPTDLTDADRTQLAAVRTALAKLEPAYDALAKPSVQKELRQIKRRRAQGKTTPEDLEFVTAYAVGVRELQTAVQGCAMNYIGVADLSNSVQSVNGQVKDLVAYVVDAVETDLLAAIGFGTTIESSPIETTANALNIYISGMSDIGGATNAWEFFTALDAMVAQMRAAAPDKVIVINFFSDFNWDVPPSVAREYEVIQTDFYGTPAQKDVKRYYFDNYIKPLLQKYNTDPKNPVVRLVGIGIDGGAGINESLLNAIAEVGVAGNYTGNTATFPSIAAATTTDARAAIANTVCAAAKNSTVPPTGSPTATNVPAATPIPTDPHDPAIELSSPSAAPSKKPTSSPTNAEVAEKVCLALLPLCIPLYPLLRKRQKFATPKPEHQAEQEALNAAETAAQEVAATAAAAAAAAAHESHRVTRERHHAVRRRDAQAPTTNSWTFTGSLWTGLGLNPAKDATRWDYESGHGASDRGEPQPPPPPPPRRVANYLYVGESTPVSWFPITVVKLIFDNALGIPFFDADLGKERLEFDLNSLPKYVPHAVASRVPGSAKKLFGAIANGANDILRWIAFSKAKRMLRPGDIGQFNLDTGELLRIARRHDPQDPNSVYIIEVAGTATATAAAAAVAANTRKVPLGRHAVSHTIPSNMSAQPDEEEEDDPNNPFSSAAMREWELANNVPAAGHSVTTPQRQRTPSSVSDPTSGSDDPTGNAASKKPPSS